MPQSDPTLSTNKMHYQDKNLEHKAEKIAEEKAGLYGNKEVVKFHKYRDSLKGYNKNNK